MRFIRQFRKVRDTTDNASEFSCSKYFPIGAPTFRMGFGTMVGLQQKGKKVDKTRPLEISYRALRSL